MQMIGNKTDLLSLYFHIPFCTKKCDYCHFFVLPDKEPLKKELMEGLKQEWTLRSPLLKGAYIPSLYFGGGTPALFGPEKIGEIISWLPPDLKREVTLEANPENITQPLMEAFAKAGVNRVSIGLQTLENPLLQTLGRIHSAEKAEEAVRLTYAAGITNISVDLMYDLPGQTLQGWQQTLERTIQLPISHLSLYNLTFEPHTSFYKRKSLLLKQVPNPEISLQMIETAVETLAQAGLTRYEISAFAKPGYRSNHNLGYWTARPFLGLGPSAFSYREGSRFRNVAHLGKYLSALRENNFPIDFEETLPPEMAQRELFAVQLRILEGVDLHEFEQRHGVIAFRGTLEDLCRKELLLQEGSVYKLSPKGMLFYDSVAVEII